MSSKFISPVPYFRGGTAAAQSHDRSHAAIAFCRVGHDGRILFKSQPGPYGFSTTQLETSLVQVLSATN